MWSSTTPPPVTTTLVPTPQRPRPRTTEENGGLSGVEGPVADVGVGVVTDVPAAQAPGSTAHLRTPGPDVHKPGPVATPWRGVPLGARTRHTGGPQPTVVTVSPVSLHHPLTPVARGWTGQDLRGRRSPEDLINREGTRDDGPTPPLVTGSSLPVRRRGSQESRHPALPVS